MTSKDAKANKSAKASKNVKRKAKTGKPEIGELADSQLDQVQGGTDRVLTGVHTSASDRGGASGRIGGKMHLEDVSLG